jgi:L-ascorbate metabolism protein UlaG (beta-lactamase superfamily)
VRLERTLRLLAAIAAFLAISSAPVAAQTATTSASDPDPQVESSPHRPATTPLAKPALGVRYLANEGFLVEAAGRRVLIDALFGAGLDGYPAVPAEVRAEFERGVGEGRGIEVALATHFHGDHFDPAAVGRFLEANPRAIFVSTPQAIRSLNQSLATQGTISGTSRLSLLTRIRQPFPATGTVQTLDLDGIRVAALNLHHGRRTPPVENLGFVVTIGDQRFIHLGDTEATLEDFEPYLELLAEPDVALLPFWFLTSEWRAEMVRKRIRPRAIVVAHLPSPDAPASYFGRWENHAELIRLIRAAFPEARIPSASGERFRFDAEP